MPMTTQPEPPRRDWTGEEARQYCRRLARSRQENFTVGSWLLPGRLLDHIYAIYAYCRTVDDLGDEATRPGVQAATHIPAQTAAGDDAVALLATGMAMPPDAPAGDEAAWRLALLDRWQAELEACYGGRPTHPVMVALAETIAACDLPIQPFLKLIEANRTDQRIHRYPTYPDLLHYCDHSANPVGRLVLHLFGYRDEERGRLADATCTALQLTNFWQDLARDYAKGRIYLPLEDMERFGYKEEELAWGSVTPNFRRLMEFETGRAMALFREGAPLVDTLDGMARLDAALFTRGGMAALEAIRNRGYDVFNRRPRLSRAGKARLFLATWLAWKLGLGFRLPGQ